MRQARADLLFDFVLVAGHGGLRAGARATRRSASTLARHMAGLEADLGFRLFERDERSFVLTAAGRSLLQRLRDPVAAITDAVERVAAEAGTLRGALRVGAPALFAQSHLARIAAGFSLLHPGVELDIVAEDRLADPVAEGFDLLIRANPDPAARLVGRRLVRTDRVAVAAPPVPVPADGGEARLVFRGGEAVPAAWTLRTGGHAVGRSGARGTRTVRLRPALSLSTLLMVREAVLAGAGAALLPRTLVGDDVAQGRLAEWGVEAGGPTEVWVLRTARRHPSPKVTAFIEHLRRAFAA